MVECLTSLKTLVEFLIKTQYVIIDQLYDKCSIYESLDFRKSSLGQKKWEFKIIGNLKTYWI